MFEKFNDGARTVLVRAKDIATGFSQDHISTGHLLLAIAGYTASPAQWKSTPAVTDKAAAVIAALGTTPDTIIAQAAPELTYGISYDTGHHPFSDNLKQALEYAVRSSMILGDDHVGPEHLLAGLARNSSGTAGVALSRLGITDTRIQAAIRDCTPASSSTPARTCTVYVPAGRSVFKNGAKIYPDLATAQAAHPGQEIAPLAFPLHDGEFFDVCYILPENRTKSLARFADYPAAFAAAADYRKNHSGYELGIRIMVPSVQEFRGKDSRGHDVVLGRAVEYTRTRIMTRIAQKEAARV